MNWKKTQYFNEHPVCIIVYVMWPFLFNKYIYIFFHDAFTFIDGVTKDGVALAAAGLPVGEQRRVEAGPGVGKDSATQIIEDLQCCI